VTSAAVMRKPRNQPVRIMRYAAPVVSRNYGVDNLRIADGSILPRMHLSGTFADDGAGAIVFPVAEGGA
jgi:hypothetical protein